MSGTVSVNESLYTEKSELITLVILYFFFIFKYLVLDD